MKEAMEKRIRKWYRDMYESTEIDIAAGISCERSIEMVCESVDELEDIIDRMECIDVITGAESIYLKDLLNKLWVTLERGIEDMYEEAV